MARKTLVLEVLLVIAIVGFVPGEVLKFYGGNSSYFSEFQYWIAAALILCYFQPSFDKVRMLFGESSKIPGAIILVLVLILGYSMNDNWGIYYRRTLDKTFDDRRSIVKPTIHLEDDSPRLQLIKSLREFDFDGVDTGLLAFGQNVQHELTKSPKYLFLTDLKQRDMLPVSEKKTTLARLTNAERTQWMECYKIPYLIPAFTGVAMYKSAPDPKNLCWCRRLRSREL